MKILVGVFAIAVWALSSSFVFAAMSSTNYEIRFDEISAGGTDDASSASFSLRDTIGILGGGDSTSASFLLEAGYRAGIYDHVAVFDLYLQDRSSQVGAISLSSTTVEVASVSGFSVGDMIAIVQDEGASQVSAIGKIESISSPNITVDFLSGGSPTIDGSGDVVYSLEGSAVSLSTLSKSLVTTAFIGWQVSADVDDGYKVYVFEDTDLTKGGTTIADVADGAVTAGQSEYGARSSDSSITDSYFDTQDEPFTTSLAVVGDRTNNTLLSRDYLTLKASISNLQSGGDYSHNLTLVYVGDY